MAQPIRDRLWQIAGIDNINIGLPNLGGGLNKPIMVALKGQDIAELDRLSREATKIIRTVPGVVDLESSLKANKPTVAVDIDRQLARSEEHTSELQSLMRISYAVFCLKKKKKTQYTNKQS